MLGGYLHGSRGESVSDKESGRSTLGRVQAQMRSEVTGATSLGALERFDVMLMKALHLEGF